MIRVVFKCGHKGVVVEDPIKAPPACPQCGERQIGTVYAPAPKFRGVGSGPLMEKKG